MTSWSSRKNRSARCEPRKPAAPVMTTFIRWSGDDRPANRMVVEPHRRHPIQRIQVAAVDDDRTLERLLDACEVRVAVLIPVGHDGERVGAGESVLAGRRKGDAVAEAVFGFGHRN